MEPLALEQTPGSRVLGTGDRNNPSDPDALSSPGRGEAVADLDAALTVRRAVSRAASQLSLDLLAVSCPLPPATLPADRP